MNMLFLVPTIVMVILKLASLVTWSWPFCLFPAMIYIVIIALVVIFDGSNIG